MNKIQALNSYWASFGLRAFDETHVPDDAVLPYITYETSNDDFGHKVALTASLWYRTYSWEEPELKQFEIAETLKRGGKIIPYDGGAIWITMGNPWAQRMSDSSNDVVRRIVLNVEVEYLD